TGSTLASTGGGTGGLTTSGGLTGSTTLAGGAATGTVGAGGSSPPLHTNASSTTSAATPPSSGIRPLDWWPAGRGGSASRWISTVAASGRWLSRLVRV